MNNPILQLQQQRLLLEIEYNHEKEEFRLQTQSMGIERKTRRGDAWFPVSIGRNYYNSLNQMVVEVTRQPGSDIEHNFEPGRPVCFFTMKRDADGHDAIHYMSFTATVSYAEQDAWWWRCPTRDALSTCSARRLWAYSCSSTRRPTD